MKGIINLNFKEKSIVAYFEIAAVVLALALVIVGPIQKGFEDRSWVSLITVMLILGIVAAVAAFLSDIKFLPFISVAFFAIAFGLVCYHGAPIIADHYNNLNFKNGDYGAVVTYCVLMAFTSFCSVVACFDRKK